MPCRVRSGGSIDFDEWWLYIYEISRLNNIETNIQSYQKVKRDFFKLMKDAGISFISVTIYEKVMRKIHQIQESLADEFFSNLE